ncbi:MAG: GGDEF domain-containing protein [Ruminococcaceae bacterium]|nr:GGDEF domain-containing protein [Oscillospiraceae bacterium]
MLFKKSRILYQFSFDTLDEQICLAVLSTGTAVSICGFFMVLIQDLSSEALASVAACVSWFSLHLGICLGRRKSSVLQRLLLICVLNFILLPFAFFASGGIHGGMALLYMLGLVNAVVLLRRYSRVIVLALSFCVMLLSLYVSRAYPQLVAGLSEVQEYRDTQLAMLLTGAALIMLTLLILHAFETERARNLELMERLRSMSTRDALSGLYNRRELTRRLDLVYKAPQERSMRDERLKREGCYIAMFDVDNFKHLNDTYGHQFGDTVLSTVAQKINEEVKPKSAEFAARYGGEEFVCLFNADTPEEAFRRADRIRQSVAELSWKDVPGLSVTVSGGLISCEKYDQLKRAMLDVDKLLYQAKHGGKNQVANEFDEENAEENILS